MEWSSTSLEWKGVRSGSWWIGEAEIFIDEENGKYEINNWDKTSPLLAGPFETLEAAKAAYLLML